ncbi:unnamed protein product [Porites evermanni]|uniref:CAP-Gly domain-containing protein n=1 Tax=Porites evermanni TaxID=104178 RepID=A0ABN8LW93_9CNID|nr:unnamed protein product [Porites evermanni]
MKSTPTPLLKGEILEALPEREQPNDSTRIVLAVIDREKIRLECHLEDVRRLTNEDADLLLAICSVGLRYQCYFDRKRLDFGRQISPGSQVFVEVKGVSKKLHGTVWYVGELVGLRGTMFGVELTKNPGQGTSDGTFRKKRYFVCALDSGVFVALDKLTPFEDSDSKVHVPVRHRVNIERKVNIVRHEVNIDERVVTFAGDAPVRGTVGYIGEDKDSNGQIHTIVAQLTADQQQESAILVVYCIEFL